MSCADSLFNPGNSCFLALSLSVRSFVVSTLLLPFFKLLQIVLSINLKVFSYNFCRASFVSIYQQLIKDFLSFSCIFRGKLFLSSIYYFLTDRILLS